MGSFARGPTDTIGVYHRDIKVLHLNRGWAGWAWPSRKKGPSRSKTCSSRARLPVSPFRPYPECSRANSHPRSPLPPEAGPSRTRSSHFTPSAVERGRDNLPGFDDFHLKNGSSQGQNLALIVLYVPLSIFCFRGTLTGTPKSNLSIPYVLAVLL